MKILIFFIVIIFGLPQLYAQDIHFEDCQQKAKNHIALSSNTAFILASTNLRLKNVKATWYPTVDLKGQVSYQNEVTHVDLDNPMFDIPMAPKDQYKVYADLTQMIYDGGLTRAKKSLEQSRGELSLAELNVQLYQIRDRVSQTYFLILILSEQGKQINAKLKVLSERLKEVNAVVKSGAALQSNADLIEVEQLYLIQQKIELEEGIKKAYGILSELVGEPIHLNQTLVLPNVVIPSIEKGLRPEDEVFAKNRAVIEKNSRLLLKTRMPKLLGFGQVGYGNPGYNMLKDSFEPFFMGGLRLQWKMWDYKSTKHQREILSYSSKMVGSQQEVFHQNQRIQLLGAESKLQAIDRLLSKDDRIIELRKKVTQAHASQLKNGTLTSADYIASLNAESAALLGKAIHQIQKVQAQVEYVTIIGINE